ncbi:MAG: radical SAM protein [Ruminococcaceae bacterium]|nr:radical SAM protein [Oscillospiraceae bacterium]
MAECRICPRRCGATREGGKVGFCGESREITVSRALLHKWEEPPISGERGTGAIFFCGCNLRCVYCQNKMISRGGGNRETYTASELCDLMLRLEAEGAHSIDLVTPTHFADGVATALREARRTLRIPVIYNSSGYDSVESLKALEGLVDVYLPDFKYISKDLAEKYSNAPDYPEVAKEALREMFRQVGECRFDGDGMIERGVIVRHLVLPAHRKESIALLDTLSELLPVNQIRLSLMSQYTPEFALDTEFKNLHRRLTTFEYNSVLEHAVSLGFDGYFQALSSAKTDYTPSFE